VPGYECAATDEPAAEGRRRLVDFGKAPLDISALWRGGGDGASRVELYHDGSAWAAKRLAAEWCC
jgi:hypothetical protein